MGWKRYRDYVIVGLALAVPFYFLRASMREPKEASGPDRAIVWVATPIQYAASTLARGLSNVWGDYVYLVDVKEDNAKLASQNARLREKVRKLEALEADNRKLRRLVDLKTSVPAETVSAEVIAKNTNEFFRIVRLTLDSEARGIGSDLPVIHPDGVVGTTQRTSGDTVDVRLVVDAGAGVDVVVQRTGARGFVRGSGDEARYSGNVELMKRTDEVEVGDLVVTSGMGDRFPKGLPVGVVTKIVKREFGVFQSVEVEPTVDFSRLEFVLIVQTPKAELKPEAEKKPSR